MGLRPAGEKRGGDQRDERRGDAEAGHVLRSGSVVFGRFAVVRSRLPIAGRPVVGRLLAGRGPFGLAHVRRVAVDGAQVVERRRVDDDDAVAALVDVEGVVELLVVGDTVDAVVPVDGLRAAVPQ